MSKHCQLIASTANTKIICFLTAPNTDTPPPTSKPTHLTLSVSSPHPLCVFVCVVSRASYILCMQVKKKRKNKSKSKDKHVFRQRERERARGRQTDWLTERVCKRRARAKDREWTSSCSLTFCDMICVLATCCQCWPGNSCLRNWAHEQLFMCTCIHTYTCMWAIVAERDFSNRFTLTFDARYLFARICCCCYAKLGFISSNDVTAHWQHCKTLHCLPLCLAVSLSIALLVLVLLRHGNSCLIK